MKRNYFSNGTFRKIQTVYILLLLVLALTFLGGYAYWIWMDVQLSNQQSAERISKELSAQIDQNMLAPEAMLQNLNSTPWIIKYVSGAFEEEFNSFSRAQYCKELRILTQTVPSIRHTILLFPEQNTAASGGFWGSIKDCKGSFLINYNLDLSAVIQKVETLNADYGAARFTLFCFDTPNYMLFLNNLEITDNPRAYAILAIEKKSLQEPVVSYLKQNPQSGLIDMTVSLTASDGAEQVISSTKSDFPLDISRTVTIPASIANYTYRYNYHTVLSQKTYTHIIYLAVFIPVFLIAGFILSFWAAVISLRPVEQFFGKIVSYRPAVKEEDATLEAAERAFDGLMDESSKILEENSRIRETVLTYRKAVRNTFLIHLIRGSALAGQNELEGIQQSLISYELPFDEEGRFSVCVLDYSMAEDFDQSAEPHPIEDWTVFLEEVSISGIPVELSNLEYALILFHYTEEQLAMLPKQMDAYLANRSGKPGVHIGPDCGGLVGISTSYYKAISHKSAGGRKSQVYYPVEWQQLLLNSMRAGDNFTADQIIKEILAENQKIKMSLSNEMLLVSFLNSTILQAIQESGLDMILFQKKMDSFLLSTAGSERWDILREICNDVTGMVAEHKQKTAESEPSHSLITYINSHYQESTISLKELADLFDLSVSAVSRTVKRSTGVNFLEYLTGLRMKLAKKLLFTDLYSITDISSMVGYENVYSFRRAFERYEGVRLQDYRKGQQKPELE